MTRRKQRPTSQDVAREAGVSQCTVSYVLSASKYADRISPETRRRVIAAAQRLGYSKNSTGVALRRGYSDTVVILAVTWELAAAHSGTTIALSRAAAAKGMNTIVHVAGDDSEAGAFLTNVASLNPYGLVLLWDSSGIPMDRLLALAHEGLPVVDLMPSGSDELLSVTADRVQGTRAATEYLIELGHRRIGMILDTTSRSNTSLQKLEGYRRALKEAGIDFQESLLQEVISFGFEAGQDGMRKLVNRRPDVTAVLCINDPMALGAISAIKGLGMSVPGDISVVGYGALAEGTYFNPTLTTLGMPSQSIASEAIEMLVRIRTDRQFVPTSLARPMELIIRESVGPVRNTLLCTSGSKPSP